MCSNVNHNKPSDEKVKKYIKKKRIEAELFKILYTLRTLKQYSHFHEGQRKSEAHPPKNLGISPMNVPWK